MTLTLLLFAAYLIGAIPTGIIITKLAGGEDIRKTGSGNIGASNVYRVAGRKLGVVTLIGDCLKAVIPLLIASQLFACAGATLALVGLAAFLGHCYPVYLGFKGGKGVATALGVFLIISPQTILCALALFALILWRWRYISLASISAAGITPFLTLLFERSLAIFLITLIIAGVVIWRHRANIDRLLTGNENKLKL
ncbi:MAG: glycerol-3-phosphate acyltransferase [Desulfuromonadales bacterium]|nr:glycerol-3-phosphate acyltransferase [Chloroflexota bacterium]MCK4621401.1 glycerol-3-phosphate acyltransferase [Desulfuromonadales bacterium]